MIEGRTVISTNLSVIATTSHVIPSAARNLKISPVGRNDTGGGRNDTGCARHNMAGFTLVEMIMVIVITGIIGGMVAVFMRAPVQQYVDVARRADMTDTADTALRRISRDVRLALPNSVRVRNNGGTVFMEFLETIAGGRYNSATIPADCLAFGNCTGLTTLGNLVDGTAGTTSAATRRVRPSPVARTSASWRGSSENVY